MQGWVAWACWRGLDMQAGTIIVAGDLTSCRSVLSGDPHHLHDDWLSCLLWYDLVTPLHRTAVHTSGARVCVSPRHGQKQGAIMGSFTHLLYARPSFLEGVARLLDWGGTLNEYNRPLAPEDADLVALRSDWEALGQDYRTALATMIGEAELSAERAEPAAR
jgi:hypothetical protein